MDKPVGKPEGEKLGTMFGELEGDSLGLSLGNIEGGGEVDSRKRAS